MPYPRRVPILSRPAARAAGVRLNTVLDQSGEGTTVSDTFTTFVSADYTPVADGTTPTTLTFTAKDATDTAIEGVSVTYA